MKYLSFTLNGNGLEALPDLLTKAVEEECHSFSSATMTILMLEKYGYIGRELYTYVIALDFTNPHRCRVQFTIGGRDEDFFETKWSFRNQEFNQFIKLIQALCQ